LEVLTSGLVAAALAALLFAGTRGASDAATWRLAAGAVVAFVVIVGAMHHFVFAPIRSLVQRSRERLGSDFERSDPRYRNETRELSYLVGVLIAVFTAGKDEEWVSQSIKTELESALAINRQLMDVGELGKEMNAALPYRETVDRVLSRTKAFLRADVVALLLLDEEGHAFSLEGAQGTLSPDSSTACCATTPDCPVRRSVTNDCLVRSEGHSCSLFPHTMTYQVVIPVLTENIGSMGLLATATSGDYISLLPDDILTALQNHVQSAVANAYKYDAIRRQVVTDHLTHLYNRRFFMNRANEEIGRTLRHKAPLSVLMVDIDHFKLFNDTHGHATGDRVLQTVARAMQDALRTSDVCARYGGEEFAMLLPNTSGENAYYVAERVRRTLQRTRYTGLGLPADVNITISVGVSTCPRDATTLDDLMRLADEALYQAKAEGRDRVVVFGAGQREAAL
jgi:diguanylate cyclase (GGDEF)-like protein